MRPRRGSERGAIAVIFALVVVILFAMAAVGVDIGNAMNRRKQLQTTADFAALAGGGFLPAPDTTPDSTDQIVQEVAKYLYDNHTYDDTGFVPDPAVIPAKIVSGNPADWAKYGRVQYGYYHPNGNFISNPHYVTVTAPSTRINFGLATALGKSGVNVQTRATAGLKSPGAATTTLPFFAYDGCDWGQQIISHSTSNASAPNLYAPTETNDAVLFAPTTTMPNANPTQVVLNDTSTTLTLAGSGLTADTSLTTGPANPDSPGITALGFFLPNGTPPTELGANAFEEFSDANQIRFRLPPTVAGNDGAVYYLRVQKWVDEKAGPQFDWQKRWSPALLDPPYVEIGSATLFCNDDKSAGNFGSLSIFRLDSTSNEATGWLPLNIALGLHEPYVKLNKYTQPIDSNSCGNGDGYAKPSDDEFSGVLVNCAVTNVGFPQNSATNGFLTGVTGSPGAPGRLTSQDAISSGCGGSNGAPPLRIYKGGPPINNELLSCYFTDSSVTVSQISSETYSGGTALDASIWGSPRFFQVPVINSQPQTGKKAFPIVDFRYAFLTGENGTAFKGHAPLPQYFWDDPEANGLQLEGNSWTSVKVAAFRVVFIHPLAVPPAPGAGTPTEFDGVDGKLHLVD